MWQKTYICKPKNPKASRTHYKWFALIASLHMWTILGLLVPHGCDVNIDEGRCDLVAFIGGLDLGPYYIYRHMFYNIKALYLLFIFRYLKGPHCSSRGFRHLKLSPIQVMQQFPQLAETP